MKIIVNYLLENTYSSSTRLRHRGIIIHGISAVNIDRERRFDPALIRDIFIRYRVSAHYLIHRDGTIEQLVPRHLKAWHAGESRFQDLTNLNRFFLGYEFVGTETEPYEDEQYRAGGWLAARDQDAYGIPPDWIVGHSTVSGPDVRPDPKWDPGPHWDWERFHHYRERAEQEMFV